MLNKNFGIWKFFSFKRRCNSTRWSNILEMSRLLQVEKRNRTFFLWSSRFVLVETNGIVSDEIEEIFLDGILTEIQRLDQTRCSTIRKSNFSVDEKKTLFSRKFRNTIAQLLVSISRTIVKISTNNTTDHRRSISENLFGFCTNDFSIFALKDIDIVFFLRLGTNAQCRRKILEQFDWSLFCIWNHRRFSHFDRIYLEKSSFL